MEGTFGIEVGKRERTARSFVRVRKEVIVNEAKVPSGTRVVNGRKEEKGEGGHIDTKWSRGSR